MGDGHMERQHRATSPFGVKAQPPPRPAAAPAGARPQSGYGVPAEFDVSFGFNEFGEHDIIDDLSRQRAQEAEVEKAKEELRPYFRLVTDEEARKKGKSLAPNEVTEGEYKRILHLYVDIVLDRTDIKMAKYADVLVKDFRSKALADIRSILQTRSGRDLIKSLADNATDGVHHSTTLASRRTDQRSHAEGADSSKRNDSINGVGQDVTVSWRPGELATALDPCDPSKQSEGFPMRSDVNAFHELVHAVHMTHGVKHRSDSVEEARTTGLTWGKQPSRPFAGFDENVYRAERLEIGTKLSSVAAQPQLVREGDAGMTRRQAYGSIRDDGTVKECK